MKKVLLYIFIFIFLCSISNYSIDYVLGKQISKQSPYYLSFASIGAFYIESRLDCWAKIKTSSSEQELQNYLEYILQSLKINLDLKHLEINSTNNMTILRYQIARPEQTLFITIKSNNRLNESYFTVSILSRDQKCDLHHFAHGLNQIIGIEWEHHYLYSAQIPHLIAEEAQKDLVKVILKNMQAYSVETYKNSGVTRVIAYSSGLNKETPALNIQGKKYNIQVVIRNSNNKGKTFVYIGSPLILDKY